MNNDLVNADASSGKSGASSPLDASNVSGGPGVSGEAIQSNASKKSENWKILLGAIIGVPVGIGVFALANMFLFPGQNLITNKVNNNVPNISITSVVSDPIVSGIPDNQLVDWKKGDKAQSIPEVVIVNPNEFLTVDGKKVDLTSANSNDSKIAVQVIAYSIQKFSENKTVTFKREVTDGGGIDSFVVDFDKGKFSRDLKKEASAAYGNGYVEKSSKQMTLEPGNTTSRIGAQITLDDILFHNENLLNQKVSDVIQGKVYVNAFDYKLTSKLININSNLKGVEYVWDYSKVADTSMSPFINVVHADMAREAYEVTARIGEDGNLYYLSIPYGYGEDVLKDFVYNQPITFN